MLRVDTSVRSEHFRRHDAELDRRLQAGDVLVHPFVVGGIACGVLPGRAETLVLLNRLPSAPLLGHAELLAFIERHGLAGQGVGLVDIHLLAFAMVCHAPLWTRDRRLARAAAALGIGPPAGRA